MGPVAEEVPEVPLGGLPAGADDLDGHGQLVERLVPDLGEVLGFGPTLPDARVGAVEEEQALQALGVQPGEGLGDIGPDVVAHEPEPLETQGVGQAEEVGCVVFDPISLPGRHLGLARLAEAPQVGRDDVEPMAQRPDHLAPDAPELRPAVEQDER